jgi:A/G-specific adenine glycosylase
MRKLPTIESLAQAQRTTLLKLWEGLGYYRRAHHLQAAARELAERQEGRLPQDPGELMKLPGIGSYTAGAIASIAFNRPAPVLDGNVSRILCRLFRIVGPPRQSDVSKRLWDLAASLVNLAAAQPDPGERNCGDLNQGLMELGAVICTPRQPRCSGCPINASCAARKHGDMERFPSAARARPISKRPVTVLLVHRKGRFLARPRPRHAVNAELWEFPNEEEAKEAAVTRRWVKRHAARNNVRFWFRLTHSITRYRYEVEVLLIANATTPRVRIQDHRWLTRTQLAERPWAGIHRKILARILDPEQPLGVS